MAKASLTLINVVPFRKARTPVRRPNAELRTREHLTQAEVDRLVEAAKGNRYGHRDATMILVAYRHGLRASRVDFNAASPSVKAGKPATHPLTGIEMRALRKLQRESASSPFVFVSERGSPFSTAGFARMLERAGQAAKLEIRVHPHMLRHACGFKLARRRYAGAAGLSRAPQYPAHGALHRAGADPVQELLA